MKERRLYMCEFCGTEYNSKEKAEECELNHSKAVEIVRSLCYYPIETYPEYKGYPKIIEVKMTDGKIKRYSVIQ